METHLGQVSFFEVQSVGFVHLFFWNEGLVEFGDGLPHFLLRTAVSAVARLALKVAKLVTLVLVHCLKVFVNSSALQRRFFPNFLDMLCGLTSFGRY